MIHLAITPEQFAGETKLWIEAGSAILDLLIVKIGILAIAVYGLLKIFRTQDAELRAALKTEIQGVKERQDRQGDLIDQVALAVPPAGGPPPEEHLRVATPAATPREEEGT